MAAEIFDTAHINIIFRPSKIKTTLSRVKSQVIFTPEQMEMGQNAPQSQMCCMHKQMLPDSS